MSNLKDSGSRRKFDTGAVRDIDENKGRCDLLPLSIVGELLSESKGENVIRYRKCDKILGNIDSFVRTGNKSFVYHAIMEFVNLSNFATLEESLLEVSIHFKEGAEKYEERNWEKGIPLHCYVDSGVRHLIKYIRGDIDERHDRAFIWNMLCLCWTLDNGDNSLIDLPFKK
jgi:hypothetical protein